MTRWAMVADLERCVGCQTCTAACRHANATSPAVQWRKVLDIEAGSFPNVNRTFVPVGCQHCADPPCMHVCPSTATRQRADGIVTIDYDICIGCAYCDVACPYQARFKITKEDFAYGDEAMQNEIEREIPARLGVAQKCTFCSDRIDFGIANGLAPGSDPRATPACVNACIADALHFGDLDDADSNVSRLLREYKSFRMHAELGTEPGFHYLYDKAAAAAVPDIPPAMSDKQAGRVRTRGVEPWHQKHWDWKASGNFLCGGSGAGLLGVAAIASFTGIPALLPGLAALAIIACGLTLLMFKIGRPLRFLHVLRQPQRSWMSREAWVAGALFPLALAALWFGNWMALIAAAVVGLIFLFCQGMILEQSKGIPAWRNPRVIAIHHGNRIGRGLRPVPAAGRVSAKLGRCCEAAGNRARRTCRGAHLGLVALPRRARKRRRADPHAGNLHRLPNVVFRRWPRVAAGARRRRLDRARRRSNPVRACGAFGLCQWLGDQVHSHHARRL